MPNSSTPDNPQAIPCPRCGSEAECMRSLHGEMLFRCARRCLCPGGCGWMNIAAWNAQVPTPKEAEMGKPDNEKTRKVPMSDREEGLDRDEWAHHMAQGVVDAYKQNYPASKPKEVSELKPCPIPSCGARATILDGCDARCSSLACPMSKRWISIAAWQALPRIAPPAKAHEAPRDDLLPGARVRFMAEIAAWEKTCEELRCERDSWRDAIEGALGLEPDLANHTPRWASEIVRVIRELGNRT